MDDSILLLTNNRQVTSIPLERHKSLVFGIYMITIAFCSTLIMQITNERAEHDHTIQPPLQDVVYDIQKIIFPEYLSRPKWFTFTELWGFTQTAMFLIFCFVDLDYLIEYSCFNFNSEAQVI